MTNIFWVISLFYWQIIFRIMQIAVVAEKRVGLWNFK
jgi:hypothetical protein